MADSILQKDPPSRIAALFPPRLTNGPAFVWYIAIITTVLHLVTANRYGYFGDEMYHMACGEHLAWGYVDQPPMIALATWLTRHVLGTSLFAVRFVPALAGMVLVWLTGLITRELGGGRFAQIVSALCSAGALVYLIMFRIYTMNAFEPILWMGCAYAVIRIVKTGNQRLWLWFGVLIGIGLENKYTILVFGFGIVAGLMLTPERKAFFHKWIWIAGLIAFAIFLPNLIWNLQNHFPFLELMQNIRASGRDVVLSPINFMVAQIFLMTPVTFPVWLIGALYFLFLRDGKPFRVLGWTFLIVLLVLMATHGKDYYATPIYPFLFAGGAVVIEKFSTFRHLAWIRTVTLAVLVVGILYFLPMGVPVLSPENYLRYQASLPFKMQPQEKSMMAEPMIHTYSWCFGWEEMVAGAAEAYNRIPPAERQDAAIFSNDFAAAGAVDIIGPRYNLPKAIGGHQSYWLWGPRQYSGRIMILLGETEKEARDFFNEVIVVKELHHPYAAPWENRPVLLCRGPKRFRTLAEYWPKLKNWD